MSQNQPQTTIAVGMSGGVDSSVAALLLKEQGFNVIGLFMKCWDDQDEHGECPSAKELEDVAAVCEKLEIPFYSINFVEEYWEGVFSHFLAESRAGRTPNPDILCNREIKFKHFYNKALSLGADFLATGHYCQNLIINNKHHLAKGADRNKDQSYFLYTLKEEILQKVLFPIGHLPKKEVREIARQAGLITSDKKDSTGICFIGKKNFRDFLSQYIPYEPGNFETLDGKIIGQHQGTPFYTIGQRKGLGIGGEGEPWFVIDKDVERNVVIIERGIEHPALFSSSLTAGELSWVAGHPPFETLPFRCEARVRYRQDVQKCKIVASDEGSIKVVFDEPQRAVTLGQSVVFYRDEICLGGGVISSRS